MTPEAGLALLGWAFLIWLGLIVAGGVWCVVLLTRTDEAVGRWVRQQMAAMRDGERRWRGQP